MESSSACRLPAFGRAGLPLIYNYFKYLGRHSPSSPVLGVQNFGLLCPGLPLLCQRLCGTFQKPLIFETLRPHEKRPSAMIPQRRARLFVPWNISACRHISEHQSCRSTSGRVAFSLAPTRARATPHSLIAFLADDRTAENSSTLHFSSSQTFLRRVIMSAAFQRSHE
jgi:hypothetical protein